MSTLIALSILTVSLNPITPITQASDVNQPQILAASQEAEGFNICNKTSKRLGALLVVTNSEDTDRLATMGWFQIQPNSCRNLIHSAKRVVAFRVKDDRSDGEVHTRTTSKFCVTNGNPHKKETFDSDTFTYQGCFDGSEIKFERTPAYPRNRDYTYTVR